MHPKEFWIVVTEKDGGEHYVSNGYFPKGPLVHEGYLMTQEEAYERAKSLTGKYGWVAILKVNTEQN